MLKRFNLRSLCSQAKRIFSIAAFSVRQRLTSPHTIVVMLILAVYIWDTYTPIKEFIAASGIKINPFIFSFFSDTTTRHSILYAGVIFAFSDTPFLNRSQPYIMIRSKRIPWVLGQVTHIIIFSGLFHLLLMLVSFVAILPSASFATDGWGRVVKTLSETNACMQYNIAVGFSSRIVTYYSPLTASIGTFLLNWLGTSFLGTLMFALGLSTKPFVGTGVSAGFIVADYFVTALFSAREYRLSPLTLTRLGALDVTGVSDYPSMAYAVCFFIIGTALFAAIAILAIRKRPIEVISEL